MTLLDRVGVTLPIIQAPMAGVSTPELASEVSNAGGLGSLGVGATDAAGAKRMIDETRALTSRAFNVNVFTHVTAPPDSAGDAAWLEALRPVFERFGATTPASLRPIYKSFADDDDMLAMLVAAAVPVVSFHFGLPTPERIAALKRCGSVLLATATSLPEALAAANAGIDAVVAQGWEAGGHRGVFDPAAPDDQLGTMALTRLLVVRSGLPVIAAGGIMDGRGLRAALDLGAVAAQLGTAFVCCPESSADDAYRRALQGAGAQHTVMTAAISGRPARSLANSFTEWAATSGAAPPSYPRAYDAGKAVAAAARGAGEFGWGAQWAGQGAPLARSMTASELLATLVEELADRSFLPSTSSLA